MLNFDFVTGVGLETLAMLFVASLALAEWAPDEPAAIEDRPAQSP